MEACSGVVSSSGSSVGTPVPILDQPGCSFSVNNELLETPCELDNSKSSKTKPCRRGSRGRKGKKSPDTSEEICTDATCTDSPVPSFDQPGCSYSNSGNSSAGLNDSIASRVKARGSMNETKAKEISLSKTSDHTDEVISGFVENDLIDVFGIIRLFSIKAVKRQNCGRYIRQRNYNYKYINLKSFNEGKIPCVFFSNAGLTDQLERCLDQVTALLSGDTEEDKDNNVISKSTRRKYNRVATKKFNFTESSVPMASTFYSDTSVKIIEEPVPSEDEDSEPAVIVVGDKKTIPPAVKSLLSKEDNENELFTRKQIKSLRRALNREIKRDPFVSEEDLKPSHDARKKIFLDVNYDNVRRGKKIVVKPLTEATYLNLAKAWRNLPSPDKLTNEKNYIERVLDKQLKKAQAIARQREQRKAQRELMKSDPGRTFPKPLTLGNISLPLVDSILSNNKKAKAKQSGDQKKNERANIHGQTMPLGVSSPHSIPSTSSVASSLSFYNHFPQFQQPVRPMAVQQNMNPMALQQNLNHMAVQQNMMSMAFQQNMRPILVQQNSKSMVVQQNMAVQQNMKHMIVQQNMAPVAVKQNMAPTAVQQKMAPITVQHNMNPMDISNKAASPSKKKKSPEKTVARKKSKSPSRTFPKVGSGSVNNSPRHGARFSETETLTYRTFEGQLAQEFNKKLSLKTVGTSTSLVVTNSSFSKNASENKNHAKKTKNKGIQVAGYVEGSLLVDNYSKKNARKMNNSNTQHNYLDYSPFSEYSNNVLMSAGGSNLLRAAEPKAKKNSRKKDKSGTYVREYRNSFNNQKRSPKKEKTEKKQKKVAGKEDFEDYISEAEAIAGIEAGDLIKGFVRINSKNVKMAYITPSDNKEQDFIVHSIVDRNRALEGDEVVLRIKPESEWVDGYRTAKVVFILNKVHPRIAIGKLKFLKENTDAEFLPRDLRFPILRVPSICWPIGFAEQPKLFEDTLFIARLTFWKKNQFPFGLIIEKLGEAGDLSVEAASILKEFCLDVTPFPPDYNIYLPRFEEIPEKEYTYREDFRQHCIFTIDPLTAKDLDDAVSCRKLPNGNYEVGVHISDAAFYLEENTPLDAKVCEKATTVYMVDKAYHMLPPEMCLYCSLLPGKDKLAFSVIWEMTEDAEVLSCRFTKSIINSCVQLAYEHAQMMIENPEKEFSESDLPKIHNGFKPKDLSNIVNMLQNLAAKMTKRRYDNGALKIDQIKLSFVLDPVSGRPLDFGKQEAKESNKLIEEFMLLANISVAQKICDAFPDIAFLRCHEPPKSSMLIDLQRSLETFGMVLDISSSKSIRLSMEQYNTDDYFGQCRSVVLNHLLTKPMTRAKYYCAGNNFDNNGQEHYALSVPIYTHFTSPIRRYADIMVHRLLAASLGYMEKPNWNMDKVSKVANNCNVKKYNAKRAGETHAELYLIHYIDAHQPFIQNAVVVDVKERTYDVIVLGTGTVVRLYLNKLEAGVKVTRESTACRSLNTAMNGIVRNEPEKKIWKHVVYFPKTDVSEPVMQIIELFSVVRVALSKVPKKNKLQGQLLRPLPTNATCTEL